MSSRVMMLLPSRFSLPSAWKHLMTQSSRILTLGTPFTAMPFNSLAWQRCPKGERILRAPDRMDSSTGRQPIPQNGIAASRIESYPILGALLLIGNQLLVNHKKSNNGWLSNWMYFLLIGVYGHDDMRNPELYRQALGMWWPDDKSSDSQSMPMTLELTETGSCTLSASQQSRFNHESIVGWQVLQFQELIHSLFVNLWTMLSGFFILISN